MRTPVCCLAFLLAILGAAAPLSADIIGGSVLRSPPQFMQNSYYGISASLADAFPFRAVAGTAWLPETLQVPLYDPLNGQNDNALFSIYSDASGQPGSPLVTFAVPHVGNMPAVYSVSPSMVTSPLQGGATYWFVGTMTSGMAAWNLDEFVGGGFTRAYSVSGGGWVVQSVGNISAYAILGSPVPEPSSIVLLGIGGVSLLAYTWRRHAGSGKG